MDVEMSVAIAELRTVGTLGFSVVCIMFIVMLFRKLLLKCVASELRDNAKEDNALEVPEKTDSASAENI